MSRSQRPPPDQPIGFPADVVDATSQWQALLLNPHHPAVQALIQARAALASDTRPLALAVADELDRFGHPAGHARAEFIRRQCAGELAEDLFADCASWGIPAFREGILAAGDFREGFLARFRDHTTSWSDNHYAQIWWYTSPEARLTQHYELWTARDGAVAVHDQLDAPYQELLEQFVVWGLPGALEVLDCPSFTLADLRRFATDPAFAEAQEVLTEMLAEADRLPPDQAWLRRGEVHYRRGEPQPAISCWNGRCSSSQTPGLPGTHWASPTPRQPSIPRRSTASREPGSWLPASHRPCTRSATRGATSG